MNKRTLFITVVVTLSFGLQAAYGLDAGNEAPKQPSVPKAAESKIESPKVESPQSAASKAQPKDKEMTKEEMLAELKGELADNEEVFDMIPGLKVQTAADGKFFYTFKGTKLEDLSKEDLGGLFTRARQAMVRVRTERIQRQLEMVAQTQRLQRITTPPQSPRTPASPPSPPRVPPTPSPSNRK